MTSFPVSRWNSGTIVLYGTVASFLLAGVFFVAGKRGGRNQDFRAFYAAGRMVLDSHTGGRTQLYDMEAQRHWQQVTVGDGVPLAFYHPAYETLLFAVLALFSFRTAYVIFAGFNLLLLWVCYLKSPPGHSPLAGSGRPALYFLSFPLLWAAFIGQNSLIALAVLTLVWHQIERERDDRAGLLLGLLLFKVATLLPLALLLGIRRKRPFIIPFLASAGACGAVSILIAGYSGTRDFLHLLGHASLAANHSLAFQRHIDVVLTAMPTPSGLLYLCGSSHLGARSAFTLNLLATALVLGAGIWIERRTRSECIAFSAAVVCAILASPHLYIYDFTPLVLPMLLLSHRALRYVAVLWFLLPWALFVGTLPYLIWFAPAVVIPLALLAVCLAELRRESASIEANHAASPACT